MAEVNDLDVDERADGGKRGQNGDLMARGAVGMSGMGAVELDSSLCILLKGAVLPYGVRAEEVKHRAIDTGFGRCAGRARLYGPMPVRKCFLIDRRLFVWNHRH